MEKRRLRRTANAVLFFLLMDIHVFRFILVYLIIGTSFMYLTYDVFVKTCKEVIEKDVRYRANENLQWAICILSMIVCILIWPTFIPKVIKDAINKRGKDEEDNK